MALAFLATAVIGKCDTYSTAVGFVRVEVDPGTTVLLADPFAAAEGSPTSALAVTAGTVAEVGDWLHLWQLNHFNTYEWDGTGWRVLGTDAPVPAERFDSAADRAVLFSRRAVMPALITLAGAVTPDNVTLQLPSKTWTLCGHPFPATVSIGELSWSGAADGDQIKVWEPASGSWLEVQRHGGEWTGNPAPDALLLAPGSGFLYLSAADKGSSVVLIKPY